MLLHTFIKNYRQIVVALSLPFLFFIPSAHADSRCAAMKSPIYHVVNPARTTGLLTPWQAESVKAIAQFGFTEDRGIAFYAALNADAQLVQAVRMYHPKTHDFFWSVNPIEQDKAEQKYGYTKQNSGAFYVSPLPLPCTQPIYRYQKGHAHRHVTQLAEQQILVADGWTLENARFYAVLQQPNTAPVFSIAIMPDTQHEVQVSWMGGPRPLNDYRFAERSQWLADNKERLNLQFVLHSGDVTGWGERDPHQYDVASAAMLPLEYANIPYVLSAGNHDTRAVCDGGSACDNKSYITVRETPLFNQYFQGRFGRLAGQYQANDLTNMYSLFEAGNRKWMVLSLELWPRTEVIEWAKTVVQKHPQHNVIVVTHSYLEAGGNISRSNGGYGANSPQYLFEQLISQYPNIRFVFSGHTGQAVVRTDVGLHGNKIASFLQAFHDVTANPVRILEVDTATDTAMTYIYVPKTGQYKSAYTWETSAMEYIR